MANDIVWFDSSETGAPVLNNVAGSLDAVLYACLVTGFRTQNLTSISVSGGVATAALAGHGYSDQRMLDIAGATPGGLNGRKLVTVTGSGTFTFPAPGVSDGVASGTITAKRSPLGWARSVTSGNVSIYSRTDVTATGMKLRVDDSGSGDAGATYARWKMIEGYSDINTVNSPSPPASSTLPAGVYVPKGANDTTAKKWVLVGDGRTLYLFAETSSYPASSYGGLPAGICVFGDAQRLASGDAYCCVLGGGEASGHISTQDMGAVSNLGVAPTPDSCWWARASTGIGGPVKAALAGISNSGSSRRLGGGGPKYPSPVDNGMVAQMPVLLSEASATFNNPLRGVLRGVADPLAQMIGSAGDASSWDRVLLPALIGTDRQFLSVAYHQQGSYGVALFDVTGPWA